MTSRRLGGLSLNPARENLFEQVWNEMEWAHTHTPSQSDPKNLDKTCHVSPNPDDFAFLSVRVAADGVSYNTTASAPRLPASSLPQRIASHFNRAATQNFRLCLNVNVVMNPSRSSHLTSRVWCQRTARVGAQRSSAQLPVCACMTEPLPTDTLLVWASTVGCDQADIGHVCLRHCHSAFSQC